MSDSGRSDDSQTRRQEFHTHHHGNAPDEGSVEQLFTGEEIARWTEHLTLRAFIVSLVIGFGFTYASMKLILMDMEYTSFGIYMGLLAFVILKPSTLVTRMVGSFSRPFTRQENTVIHTCVFACVSVTLSGGFGSYYLAMSPHVAGHPEEGDDVKELDLGWLMLFLFLVNFIGIFTVVPLAKVLLLRHRLTYPSGATMAHLINAFHSPWRGGITVSLQQKARLFVSCACAFLWLLFDWTYSSGPLCGFRSILAFGLEGYLKKFYLNFSPLGIGVGMISDPVMGISMLLGAVVSWQFLWPFIKSKEGDWFPRGLRVDDLHGFQGYKLFTTMALVTGDGLFHMGVVVLQILCELYIRRKQKHLILPFNLWSHAEVPTMSYDDRRRTNLFIQDQIPVPIAFGGYLIFATVSAVTIPVMFPSLRFYQVAVAYLLAPWFSFCNAYFVGLTDFSVTGSFSKFTVFVFASWNGAEPGSVLGSLAAGAIVGPVVNAASDLMVDFSTGYLTMTSPRSMFVAQILGTAMGCIIGPLCFFTFDRPGAHVGSSQSKYKPRPVEKYRTIAELSAHAVGGNPKHILALPLSFFFGAILMNSVREVARGRKWRVYRYLPNMMAMAVGFYIGAFFAFDMTLGAIIFYLWRRSDRRGSELFGSSVAHGLIAGELMWSIPLSITWFFNLKAPMCAKALPRTLAQLAAPVLSEMM